MHAIALDCSPRDSRPYSTDRFTADRTAADRRLDPRLEAAEAHGRKWGEWTRQNGPTPLPTMSAEQRANSGGHSFASNYLPDDVVYTGMVIARFPPPWQETARCYWQYMELSREVRAKKARISEMTMKIRMTAIRWSIKIAWEIGVCSLPPEL